MTVVLVCKATDAQILYLNLELHLYAKYDVRWNFWNLLGDPSNSLKKPILNLHEMENKWIYWYQTNKYSYLTCSWWNPNIHRSWLQRVHWWEFPSGSPWFLSRYMCSFPSGNRGSMRCCCCRISWRKMELRIVYRDMGCSDCPWHRERMAGRDMACIPIIKSVYC